MKNFTDKKIRIIYNPKQMRMKKKNLLNDSLTSRLAKYSAAAGAIIAISSNADAQVAYSGVQDITYDTQGVLNSLDLNGDGITDFYFGLDGASAAFGSYTSYNSVFIRNPASNSWLGSSNPYTLSSGYLINSTASWSNSGNTYNLGDFDLSSNTSTNISGFVGTGDNYLGVRFEINPGEFHYGWMKIAISADCASLIVRDWAYQETYGTDILAGSILDERSPTAILGTVTAQPVSGDFDITITFNERIIGLLESGVSVTNGAVKTGSLITADDGLSYTATITPDGLGDVIIALPAGAAQDATGNDNEAAIDLVVDAGFPPTVTLSTLVTQHLNGEFDITITFSEKTTGLLESEINVTNGVVKASSLVTTDGGKTYIATITPGGTDDVTIALPAGVAQDAGALDNEASNDLVIANDVPPTVTLSTLATEPVNGDFDISITFSEAVSGLEESEIIVTNGSVKALSIAKPVGESGYIATITPAASGDVTIALPAAVVLDGTGNDNEAATDLVVVADLDAPTVAITSNETEPVNGEFDITLTFNEKTTGLDDSELTVTNGSVKANTLVTSDEGLTYTATIVPIASGDVTIALQANVTQDLAGNGNEAATNLVVVADLDAPTVALTTAVTEPVSGEFDITITFSEKTTGLEESEFTITNGTVKVSSLLTSDEGLSYTVTIVPTASGDVTIALPANVAQDAAGNDNEAATNLVVVADITIGIDLIQASKEILAYPNPTNGFMTLDLSKSELDVKYIAITDLLGRSIHNQDVTSKVVDLDLSSYEKGIYILIMQTNTIQITKKIVIK